MHCPSGNEYRLDLEKAMAKGTAAVILVILIIGAVSGYFFYTRYVQGTVVLSITDPPQVQPANGQQYDPSILHIYLTFATIEIHQAGFGNSSNNGWYAIGNVTYSIPSDSLKVSITGGAFQSSPGTTVNLRLTLSFNSNEILAMNGQLTPHATAQVVT